MEFLKKNWSNIILIFLVLLLLVPQTRKPIQVGVNRLISLSPSRVPPNEREVLQDYHWELLDMDNRRQNFQYSAGRVAIVNLWATWCPPCIAEMPSFQKLYNEYEGKVDFYFVSTEEKERLESFLIEKDYDLPVYRPISLGPEHFISKSLPTTFVLSRKGEIVVKKTGAANWNDAGFKELLDDLLQE